MTTQTTTTTTTNTTTNTTTTTSRGTTLGTGLLRTSPTTSWRRAAVQIVAVALIATACGGGDDDADDAGTSAGDVSLDAEATGAEDASADEPTQVDEPDETVAPTDPAESDDPPVEADTAEPGEQGDDGGSVSGGDIDWATVDLTTIDWANIDIDDIDFAAVEANPTVGNVSEDDIAIFQERMAARFGSGGVTLTIADRTWEFDGFQCAFESSGLLQEGTTLATNLFGEVEGARIQMQIDVYDDGTAQFTMDDIDDFENPSVSYLETTDIAVTVDGNTVRAEGDVTDQASDTFDVVPMTFEGECGPGSIR